VSGDTEVFFSNLEIKTINDIIKERLINETIFNLNENNNIKIDTISKIFINGVKEVFKLKTRTGRELKCTNVHEILTNEGWKEYKSLEINKDYAAVVSKIEIPYSGENKYSIDFFKILGYLIGDGSIASFHRVVFESTSTKYINDFENSAKNENISYSRKNYKKEAWGKIIQFERIIIYGGKNGWKKNLRDLNLIGDKSQTKKIAFIKYLNSVEIISAFLSRLYATDGYICISQTKKRKSISPTIDIGYVTISHELAKDIQNVLLRINVSSTIRSRKINNGISKQKQFIVNIRDKKNALQFLSIVSVYGKEKKCEEAIELLKKASTEKKEIIPLGNYIRKRIKEEGYSFNSLWKKHNISLGRKGNVSKDKAKKINKIIKDNYLTKVLSEDIIWDRIVKKEFVGRELVYDLEIKNDHNYIANGLIVHNCVDEVQDILWDNIPVIQEVLSHASDPKQLYAGTPKTFENPIEKRWLTSSQCEWVVPCDHHTPNFWNVLGLKNIGKTGPICEKCGKPIDTTKGRWVRMRAGEFDFMGFRIPQLMVKWKQDPKRWYDDIVLPMEGPSAIETSVYMNEKLGLSSDNAEKPITRAELIRCCDNTSEGKYRLIDVEEYPEKIRGAEIFLGVDWGTGTERFTPSGKKKPVSYSIVTLGTMLPTNIFWFFYYKRFKGAEADPDFILEFILKINNYLSIRVGAVDWGFGWGPNNTLMRKMEGKIMPVKYEHNQKKKIVWDRLGYKFQVNRSLVMSEFFYKIKNQKLQFGRWDEFESYGEDFLAIFKDYTVNPLARNSLFYNHSPTQPDDAFHSSLLCEFAYNIYHSNPV
jgi:intein/homing endonuclease